MGLRLASGESLRRRPGGPLIRAALLAEYEDVLGRDALFQRSGFGADEQQELLDIFVAQCEWVRVHFAWRPKMTTVMPAGFDAETRFKLRAERGAGKAERGLALLDRARRQRSTR